MIVVVVVVVVAVVVVNALTATATIITMTSASPSLCLCLGMFIYSCLSCFLCAQEVDRFSESFPSRDSKQGAVRPFDIRDMGRS